MRRSNDRARFQFDHQMARYGTFSVFDDAQRSALTRRHQNFLARHRPDASQRRQIRVAEGLILAGGEGGDHHFADLFAVFAVFARTRLFRAKAAKFAKEKRGCAAHAATAS